MKRFLYFSLLAILVCPAAQAAPARTYNSSQIAAARSGASEDVNNWFYQVQPLAKAQPITAPTVKEHQQAATATAPPKPKQEKDVQAIPAPRPQRKTDKDTRKIDVTKEARDQKKVHDQTALASKAEIKAAISRTDFEKTLFDRSEKDPNFRVQSSSNGGGILTPTAKPKKRKQAFADWP